MVRRTWIGAAMVVGFLIVTANAFAQAPAGRAGAPQAQAPAAGRGGGAPRPAPLFKEEWRQPPYTGTLNDENRRATQAAVTNPELELKLYGPQAREVGVYTTTGRVELWTGMSNSPVAILVRHRVNDIDLTGQARLRGIVRSANLHVLHPAVKLADGTLVAGSQTIDTEGEFFSVEVAFGSQRWYKLHPETLAVMAEVRGPDLSKIEEVGFIDLAPGGGHGSAGYANISTLEVFAKAVPRTAGPR